MAQTPFTDETLNGNLLIEEAILQFHTDPTDHNYTGVCMAIRKRIKEGGHLIFPAESCTDPDGNTAFSFKTLDMEADITLLVAFTSRKEQQKGPPSGAVSHFIDSVLEPLLQMEHISGLILNPWGDSVVLGKEDIAMILSPGSERLLGYV